MAADAARRGMALAQSRVGADQISGKVGRDIVTDTDVAVEELVQRLLAEGSTAPMIGEERGGEPPTDGSGYWLVDPICGTRNYASGTPLYCVNLALVEDGRVAVAAVADPTTGDVLIAQRGQGAWAMRDDSVTRLHTSADTATIVVEDGKSQGDRREEAASFAARAIRADRWDFRSLGTTLSLPYVAAGRISAYVLFEASALHTAAGTLLVTEAGGTVTQVDGAPWTLASSSLVAGADERLHGDLIEMISSRTAPS